MGLLDNLFAKPIEARVAQRVAEREKALQAAVPAMVAKELEKSYDTGGQLAAGLQRYGLNFNLYDQSTRQKPTSSVSFDTLRRFSVTNEIVRAAINARKRQITQLAWEIVPIDKNDKTDYSKATEEVRAFFKGIGGYKVRFRELIDTVIEDLLVLDAVALYKQRAANNQLLSLIPVDAATIVLRVDEAGNTPLPPEIAFKQIINGKVVAELTADELIYEMMNPRSNTPYGLPPIESLILVISSMLRSELYNLNYLTDGNIPEGIFHVPESWTAPMIQEFQSTWDAYLAGDSKATAKLRFMPGGQGAGYVPTKKPTDMAFHEFNQWLMQIICAMFDIPPQELGFTQQQSTRANAKEQTDIAMRRSMLPLANFLTEIWNDIVQEELGYPGLQFKYIGIEDRDLLTEAQVQQIQLASGLRTVDELREDQGWEPLGVTTPYVIGMVQDLAVAMNNTQPQTVVEDGSDDTATGTSGLKPGQDKPQAVDASKPDVPYSGKSAGYEATTVELRKMRDFAVKRLKDGKALRPFESDVLPETTVKALNQQIADCTTPAEAKAIFRDFMKDEQVAYLADVQQFKKDLETLLAA